MAALVPPADPLMDSALEQFSTRCNNFQSTVLVFYRGERSFFCKQWLRRWLAIPAIERRLELADTALLFVSSQSQGKAYSVAAQIVARRPSLDNRVFFFGDPEHLLVSHLDALGFSKPIVTNPDSHRAHGWVFDFGMVQPAVIATAADGSLLYEWVSKPSLLNVAGKLDRPDPFDVWDTIERRLDRIRIIKARAARAAAARWQDGASVDTDQALVVTQPSMHSVGDVSRPMPLGHVPDAREEKSDSELVPSVPRLPSDRNIRKARDRQGRAVSTAPKQERATQVEESSSISPKRMESDGIVGPLSTTIEMVMKEEFEEKDVAKEEPDVSDGDIASIPVKHFSADINALATEVLAENTMSFEMMREKVMPIVGGTTIGKENVGSFSPDFMDEFEDIRDCKVDTDGEDNVGVEEGNKVGFGEVVSADDTNEDSTNDDFSIDEFERLAIADDDFIGSTHSTRATSRVDSVTEPLTQPRFSDCFDLEQNRDQQAQPEPIEASVPSLGSDQVDSSLLTNRFGSVRTEDSSHVNTVQFQARGFSMERTIVEEADDKKTGISDYLKELKEPEKRHYRVRGVGNIPGGVYLRTKLSDATAAKAGSLSDAKSENEKDGVRLNGRWISGTTVGVNHVNEIFRGDTDIEGDSLKSMKGETDSPHPEVSGGGVVVDISPFADANHGMEKSGEEIGKGIGKGRLRDEYEAYDEYIVCEFEVEEYVEEYDSDHLSHSRVYVSGVLGEGGPEENATREVAVRAIGSEEKRVRDEEEIEIVEIEVRGEERDARGGIGKRGRSVVGDSVEDEGCMGGMGSRGGMGGSGGGGMGMMWMFRRMGVAKRGHGREEGEKLGRKESVRMQRGEVEEEEERVGRKETLRAVLRRLPGSGRKWGSGREEEEERGYMGGCSGGGGGGGGNGGGNGRRGGLQAVLQRFPSLSGSARGKGRAEMMEEASVFEIGGGGGGDGGGGGGGGGGEGVRDGEEYGAAAGEGEKVGRKRSVALWGGSKTWRFRFGVNGGGGK